MWFLLILCMQLFSLDFGFGSQLHSVQIISEEFQDVSAVSIDVVIVYDAKLADQLSKMSSEEYFATVADLVNQHSEQIYIWRIQQPSKSTTLKSLHWPANQVTCMKTLVFVDLRNGKPNRINLDRGTKHVKIILGRNAITHIEQSPERLSIVERISVVLPTNTILLGK